MNGTKVSDLGDGLKRMSIREFREKGYLQELNRAFLHPLGLALEVTPGEIDEGDKITGIWDYRDDPEGLYYAIADSKCTDEERLQRIRKNADFINAERERRRPIREDKLGFWQEPIPQSKI